MRRGYLTTEFWVTVLFDAGVVLTELTKVNVFPQKYAALAAALATAAYAISRGLAKGDKSGV